VELAKEMRLVILTLLLVLSGMSARAQGPETLSLQEACRKATDSSPTLRRLQMRSQEALYRVDEAAVPGNPRASFSANYSYITPELNFGPYPLIVNNNYSVGLVLEQAILTFGRLKWGTEAARLAHLATLQQVVRERQRIAYETALLYSRLVTAQAAIAVFQGRILARQALVHDLQLRVQAGSSARFEKLVAEVTLAEDRQKLLQAQQRQSVLNTQLLVKLGLPTTRQIALELLTLPAQAPIPSVEQAYQLRPEMKSIDLYVESATAKISYERSQNAPELDASTRFEQRNTTAFQTGNQWMVGLTLRIPILDGGLSAARTKQAQAALGQLQESRLELERQILLELKDASSHLVLSRAQLELAHSQIVSAQEARRIGELRFKTGVGTHQEVLDVQAHAAEAELGLLEAEQAVREAVWEIAWVTSEQFPF
jgi:outer membrane protein